MESKSKKNIRSKNGIWSKLEDCMNIQSSLISCDDRNERRLYYKRRRVSFSKARYTKQNAEGAMFTDRRIYIDRNRVNVHTLEIKMLDRDYTAKYMNRVCLHPFIQIKALLLYKASNEEQSPFSSRKHDPQAVGREDFCRRISYPSSAARII